jgi:hypothetical protein
MNVQISQLISLQLVVVMFQNTALEILKIVQVMHVALLTMFADLVLELVMFQV